MLGVEERKGERREGDKQIGGIQNKLRWRHFFLSLVVAAMPTFLSELEEFVGGSTRPTHSVVSTMLTYSTNAANRSAH